MNPRVARLLLKTYGLAGAAAYPFLGPYFRLRARRGKEDRARRKERYGYASVPRPKGPLVWIHAASASHAHAVSGLSHHLVSLGLNVLVTTGTVVGAKVVEQRFDKSVIHHYVPLDIRPAIRRFLDHWQPDLVLIAESEIWPITVLELQRRRIAQIVVDGHLSDRAYAAWSRRSDLAHALLASFGHVFARTEAAAERFQNLGAWPVSVSGDLSFDAAPMLVDPAAQAKLDSVLGQRPVWAAIGVAPDEEEAVIRIHNALAKRIPGLATLITLSNEAGVEPLRLDCAKRNIAVAGIGDADSSAQPFGVLLGGASDIGLFGAAADLVFFGQTLAEGGTCLSPLDAARSGIAVLSGPIHAAHADHFAVLEQHGGALKVDDIKALGNAVGNLLTKQELRHQIGQAASACIAEQAGALGRTVAQLEPHIRPLLVKAKLEGARS